MNQMVDIGPLPAELAHLIDAGSLSAAATKTGKRLLERLQNETQIVLAGPKDIGQVAVFEALSACGMPQVKLRRDAPYQDADICLWCTSDFTQQEQEIWKRTPERLKDHSLLVLIATGETAAEQLDPTRIDVLERTAAEEFYGLFPLPSPGAATTEMDTLVQEVRHIVQTVQRADAENARLFLATYQRDGIAPAKLDQASSSPAPTSDKSAPSNHQAALEILCNRAAALEPLLGASTDTEYNKVLSICEETAMAVCAVLSPQDGGPLTRDNLQSAADEILLLSLEGGPGPALIAVTSLLQIKRELAVESVTPTPLFT